jgi:hypothetical protein
MDNYESIKEDLSQILPREPLLAVPLYDATESATQQIKFLLKQLRRAKSTNNRKEMLLNAWYIGEIIETHVETLLERSLCMKLLSPYYQKVVIRTYYIFEFLGTSQIVRSQWTTLTMISKLKQTQYRLLQQEAATIAGARYLEEEVVNL